MTSVHLVIKGRVQGVAFRYFVQEKAVQAGLKGWVKNRPEGSVEAHGQGEKSVLEAWITQLRQGPPMARVESIAINWEESSKPSKLLSSSFEIR